MNMFIYMVVTSYLVGFFISFGIALGLKRVG